jgi:hypothetical protein
MTEQQYNDIEEYRKYVARQAALRWKRRIEEDRKRDTSYGYYS